MGDDTNIETTSITRDDVVPGYPVGAVAERLGVPTPTLRSWAQRYGIGPRAHRRGRHRLYTDADIAALERMVALIKQGASAASAAEVVRAELPGDELDGALLQVDVQALSEAAERLDTAGLVLIVEASLRRRGVIETWNQLCRPAFRALDERQRSEGGCIDVEHALAWAVSTSLGRIGDRQVGPAAVRAVLACVPGEAHSLPLEALRAAMAENGDTVHMLGPDVPTEALHDAIRRTGVDAVVVWSHTPETATRAAASHGGTHARVFAAGPGWFGTRLPRAVVPIDDLEDGLAKLRAR